MLSEGSVFIVFGGVFFVFLSSFLAYKLGKNQEKIDRENKRSQMLADIRSVRSRLDDADVVERLHNTFKR